MNPIYSKQIDDWQTCEVNALAAKFHRFNPTQFQYDRVSEFYLDGGKLDELFQSDCPAKSFDIWFGIDEKQSLPNRQISIRLFIHVFYDKKKTVSKEMEFDYVLPGTGSLATEVPHEFKTWLSRNWMALDVTLIDDVFSTSIVKSVEKGIKQDAAPPSSTIQRLRGYHVTEDHNNAVLRFLLERDPAGLSIQRMIFHFGVDMNKYSKPGFFAFAPVIEFQMNEITDGQRKIIQQEGLRYFALDNSPDPVYFEYMKPCPSTCDTDEGT